MPEEHIADRVADTATMVTEWLRVIDEPGESREQLADVIMGLADPATLPPRLRKPATELVALADELEREHGRQEREGWARTIAYDFTASAKDDGERTLDDLEREHDRREKYGEED